MALAELLVAPDVVSADQRRANPGGMPPSASPYASVNRIQFECGDGNELLQAINAMVQSRVDLFKLFNPPQLSEEGVQKMMRSVVVANPNAPKIPAEFSVRYPAKSGSRTGVQMMLLVPRAELTAAEAGGVEMYTLDVTGEVLRDGELFEKYRYRFDFPATGAADKLPVVVDRLLRPADYVSRIKITDAQSGAEAVLEQPITVPEIFDEPAPAVASAAPAAAIAAAAPAPEVESKEPRLRIIPPPEPASGLQTVETLVTGEGIRGVEFSLDGRKIAVRRADPFSLDVEFGDIPRMRRIRAVALGANDKPLTGDEITVNAGTDPFRVRIVSPRVAPGLSGMTRVEMEVSVPDDDELESVELYWNQTRLATLYGEPFVQTIDIPSAGEVGYLRAVANLEDSNAAPAEDVVMFNTPAYMEELNVHLVELPTTVIVNGKPSDTLTEKSFRILDEGQPVQLAKFDYVKNLPLSIGMAIDSSGSMLYRMEEAQKAGAQFFEKVMRKGDKAFLVAFDKEPQLLQKWSPRIADVHAGLARVRAEDKTALYDAIIYALYHFQGVRGQKALVLISDGRDTASKFSFDQALEYARRSGIPIYGVGIGIRGSETDVRFKLDKICKETGGSVYYIDQARDLQKVYDDIQTELRSQYILGFYPSPDIKPGSKWRELTVQVEQGKVKTIKGYFP
jgi:Ca-activated chloride channel family protein